MTHQLWDLVRPRTEHPPVWRVIEILPNNRLIAERQPGCLEPARVHRIEADFDHFISLEEEEEEE